MVLVRLEGGLANQMFQMAFIKVYAKKHRLDYYVPMMVLNPHISWKGAYVFPGIKYGYYDPSDLPAYKEKHFHYEEIPKMDNVCFHGFFQSYRYFNEYREEILKAFGFEWKMKKDVCSIHVRRTDYLKWADYHPPVTEEYLTQAIKTIIEKTDGKVKFKFFSDDINFCRMFAGKLFFFSEAAVEYSEGKTEIEDMTEASGCRFNIGSNSAYSFWIHYLNQSKNKTGIFPQKNKWFGPLLPHNVDDLYMEKWLLV